MTQAQGKTLETLIFKLERLQNERTPVKTRTLDEYSVEQIGKAKGILIALLRNNGY